MKALLLAAGEGTRLRPLTLDRPKPMVPVGGRPVLEHLVALARVHGVSEIAINLHYKPAPLVAHFGDGARFGVSISYSHEDELLGSAGAAKQLEAFLDETFFVIYGDVLTDLDLTVLAAHHRSSGALVTVALYEVEDPTRAGIVDLTPDGRIRRFVEKPAPDQVFGDLANAGVYVVEPAVLGYIPAGCRFDFGSDLFPLLLDRGLPLAGLRAPGHVLDIGSPERYQQAEADWQAGRFAGLPGAPARPTIPEVTRF